MRSHALFLAAALLATTGAAAEVLDEINASASNLAFRTRDSSDDVIFTNLARLRLTARGTLGVGGALDGGDLSWFAVYDHEVLAGGLVESPDFAALAAIPEPTRLDIEGTVAEGGSYRWRHRLYRATAAFDWGGGVVRLGRQRVAWGSGRIWNPTDRFNPVAPLALEPAEKIGVDAGAVTVRFPPFASLEMVAGPGQGERNLTRKLALRWRDTVDETDYALLAGRIGDEDVIGIDVTTNLYGGGARLEAAQSWPDEGRDFQQISGGYDFTLTNETFLNGLYFLFEYFYNGAADGSAPSPVPSDRLETRRRHFAGFSAGIDLAPLWRLDGLVLADLEKHSYVLAPSFTWSAAEEIDAVFALQFFAGDPASEYGDGEHILFTRIEVFF